MTLEEFLENNDKDRILFELKGTAVWKKKLVQICYTPRTTTEDLIKELSLTRCAWGKKFSMRKFWTGKYWKRGLIMIYCSSSSNTLTLVSRYVYFEIEITRHGNYRIKYYNRHDDITI